MLAQFERENIELHQFFQDWYNGVLAPKECEFARLENALAPGFTMVAPDGNLLHRGELVAGLRAAQHSREGMRIWIENVGVRHDLGKIFIVIYQEWQEIEGRITARLSSATFTSAKETPNGLIWLHVHETWLKNMPIHEAEK